jgi:adenylate kinase
VPLNVLLLGPQGAGKGTQAKRIASEYGIAHISTGDRLRAEAQSGSELGQRVAPIMEAGELVPDELMIDLIRDWITREDAREGFVLDGFPRTLPQAQALDEMLADVDRPLSIILELQVPDQVARERMLKRAAAENRADDTPEAIDRRLELYHEKTRPISDHYYTTHKLVGVHGDRSVNEVWAEIQEALEQANGREAA